MAKKTGRSILDPFSAALFRGGDYYWLPLSQVNQ
jgi:hypothetical protein